MLVVVSMAVIGGIRGVLHSTHRRDVESEESTTYDRNGRYEVDVAYLIHRGDLERPYPRS
jgi:hypothetical protein